MGKNEDIRLLLETRAEERYRAFSSRLLPGVDDILGVRLPALRVMARGLAAGDWRTYLDAARDDSFEEIMLQGMALGYARAALEEKAPYIARFLKKIDNWSVCDSFCASLKAAKEEPEAMLALIDGYLPSEETFAARFAVVQLLMYYMDEAHLPGTLLRLHAVRAKGEPAQMAVAWALSIAYKCDAAQTLSFMRGHEFEPFVCRHAIRKMMELAGVTREERAMLRDFLNGLTRKQN